MGERGKHTGQIDFGICRHCFMTESSTCTGGLIFYISTGISVLSPSMTGKPDNYSKRGPGQAQF